jgi:hypothetical protein
MDMGITSGECMCVRGKKEQYGKLGFIVQGLCPCTPLKELLKKFLKNPQNFQKAFMNNHF